MPIEFSCPQCEQLLRTPDESAGKQARCPQCGQIVPVPSSAMQFPGLTPAHQSENPFADAAISPQKPLESGEWNPYAAPRSQETTTTASWSGELSHRTIDMGEVLSVSWRLFTEELGQCALIGLIYFGAMIGLFVLSSIFGVVQQAAGGSLTAVIVTQLANYLTNFVVQTWLGLGMAAWAVKMARTRRGDVNDLFTVGPYYLRGLGAGLLWYALLLAGAAILVGLPVLIGWQMESEEVMAIGAIVGGAIAVIIAIFVSLTFFLYYFFIVDRNAGIIESFQLSAQFMRGNRLTVFAIVLVIGVVGGIFSLCTCYLGFILYMPYLMLAMALLYLMATGQPHAGEAAPIKQI